MHASIVTVLQFCSIKKSSQANIFYRARYFSQSHCSNWKFFPRYFFFPGNFFVVLPKETNFSAQVSYSFIFFLLLFSTRLFQPPNFEHPSTSATTFLPTFKVFNHPDAVPQISTTMFILPNYIVGDLPGNRSQQQQSTTASENLSMTITDVTTSGAGSGADPMASSCIQCNFLGWQGPTTTTVTSGGVDHSQKSTLRRNQSYKMPETERKICQHDSFLWLGLKLGVM